MSAGAVRSYEVEQKGGAWKLRLTEGGEDAGGGSFPVEVDTGGFDAGYQGAIDAGEDWIQA